MAALLRGLMNPGIMAGVGAAAAGLAGAAYAFSPKATNSCKFGQPQSAYQKFMPAMDYPDLSIHNNCLKNVLTPQMYAKLRDLVRFF